MRSEQEIREALRMLQEVDDMPDDAETPIQQMMLEELKRHIQIFKWALGEDEVAGRCIKEAFDDMKKDNSFKNN